MFSLVSCQATQPPQSSTSSEPSVTSTTPSVASKKSTILSKQELPFIEFDNSQFSVRTQSLSSVGILKERKETATNPSTIKLRSSKPR
jgi:hypothetical protein